MGAVPEEATVMRTGQVAAGRGPRRLVSACLVGATGLGFLAFTLSAGADVLTVSGSAYGASGTVTVDDLDPGTEPTSSVLEQTPTVTLPPGGGSVAATAGSISFGPGGGYLSTGPSEVKTEGTTGPSGGSTSTASVSTVDAMGYLTTSQLSSTCVATETGLTAWTVLSPDAMLVLDASTTTALPAEPAPQTEYRGVSNGDSYTVILNEQSYDPISITVTAVHIILEGPTTVGHAAQMPGADGAPSHRPAAPAGQHPR